MPKLSRRLRQRTCGARHRARQQQLRDGAGERRPDDARLLLGSADAADRRPSTVRRAVLRRAHETAGTRGKAAPDASLAGLRKVDLRVPGGAGFSHLTGEVDQSTDVTGAYGGFVDVTALVQRGGSGEYTVANVQSATGEDRYAGWALVVAYEAPGDPPRNLTVFDGLQSVTQSKRALTIPVSGFQTPLSGPVRTRLGFVAYEGDRGLTGDGATLDGKAITDPLNPANNLFNSVISVDGKSFTDKTPDYINQLGFDAKLIRIDGVLANGATSASIALRTSSDQYLPQVVTFATDLYAPVIHATKTVENLTHPDGPTGPGDRLRYTVAYKNDGLEAATNFVAFDDLRPIRPTSPARCGSSVSPQPKPRRLTCPATTSENTTRPNTRSASIWAAAHHRTTAVNWRSPVRRATRPRSASRYASTTRCPPSARSGMSRRRRSSRRRSARS